MAAILMPVTSLIYRIIVARQDIIYHQSGYASVSVFKRVNTDISVVEQHSQFQRRELPLMFSLEMVAKIQPFYQHLTILCRVEKRPQPRRARAMRARTNVLRGEAARLSGSCGTSRLR